MTGVGLSLPQLGPFVTPEVVEGFACRAEELGFTSLWAQDHFLFALEPAGGYAGVPGARAPDVYRSVWAPTEMLAAVAAWTDQITVGTSVLVAGNHWPVPLANRLATIDVLAAGRLVVGLGVGWSVEEHDCAGVDFHTRGRRMDDFVAALVAAWGDDPVDHHGPFFDVPPCVVQPKPVQRPRPRLLSGMWSAPGLDRTVRDFDGWNPAGLPVAKVAEIVAGLNARRAPDQAPLEVWHRSFLAFPTSRPDRPDPGIDGVVAEVVAARNAGFTEVIVEPNFWDEIRSPGDWLKVPDRLVPLLDATGGT